MDAITSHTSRSRQRSRIASETITSHDPISERWVLRSGLAGPILFVDQIGRPTEVAAGGTVDVSVEVVNAALSILNDDPDMCQEGAVHGYNYEVTVTPNWPGADAETQSVCLSLSEDRERHEFAFDAPDTAGTYDLTVEVVTPGSDNSASGVFELSVPDEGGERRPGDDPIDADPDNGTGGGGGGGSLFGGGSGLTAGFAGGLGFVLLLLILVVAVGGE